MAEIRTKRWNDPAESVDGTRIFVARYRPRFLRKSAEPWDEWSKGLAPSRDLHAAWYGKGEQRKIEWEEYVRRYRREMEAQQESICDLAGRHLGGETFTLLCYCADEARCHRALLKKLVEQEASKPGDRSPPS